MLLVFFAAKQVTVRDFTMVFDAYTQFEESVLTAKMRMAEVTNCLEEQNCRIACLRLLLFVLLF